MRFVDIFAGIGGFRYGLERAGHTPVGHIEWDKFASKSYEAMYDLCPCKFADTSQNAYVLCKKDEFEQCKEVEYGTNCESKSEWYGKDIKCVTSREIPEAEIWTFGFPCTDVSISNNLQRGLDGSRSGLFFNVIGLLQGTAPQNRPQWVIAENVKNLLSIKGGRDFAAILAEISALGYDIEWCLVNSKNFFVPQNRERVYIVGHLRGGSGGKIFPLGRPNPTALAQVQGGCQGERIYNSQGLSTTLTSNSGGVAGKCGLYTVSFNRLEGIRKEIDTAHTFSATDGHGLNRNQSQTAVIHQTPCASFIDYDREGKLTDIARCVTARQNAGYRHHIGEASAVILCEGKPDCVRAVLTPDRIEKRQGELRSKRRCPGVQNGRRIKEEGEPSFTLTCQDRHGIMFCNCEKREDCFPINDAKKCDYNRVGEGDGSNLSSQNSEEICGNVGEQCARTLMSGGTMEIINCCRIRRLTPRECFRLQAFPDVLFDKARAIGTSDAQLYKQAGNAVTTNVVYEIGLRLKEIEEQGEFEAVKTMETEVDHEI